MGRTVSRVNEEWALNELAKFVELIDYRDPPGLYAATYVGSDDRIAAQRVVAEAIWERVIGTMPTVRRDSRDRLRPDREWAIRCQETIRRGREIRANLGDSAPDLNAASLHPWVWEGARPLWQSHHYAEAVSAAAKKVNAETQNKVSRRDIRDGDLIRQILSDDDPQPGKPRLRHPWPGDEKSRASRLKGMRSLGDGWYAAFRNPAAHQIEELSEVEALERLAGLSLLARFLDEATLVTS